MALSTYIRKMDEYTCDTVAAMKIYLVRKEEELAEKDGFHPQVTHQLFDRQDLIGYKDLSIKVYFSACSLDAYLVYDYADRLLIENSEVLINPIERLKPLLPANLYSDIDSFRLVIANEHKNRPVGTLLARIRFPGNNRIFKMYVSTLQHPTFCDYFKRLQFFLLTFIDAASFPTELDIRWCFFLLYEAYHDSKGNKCYAFAGLISVYEFFAYPSHTRPRISQVLVLPPYQKIGLCCWALKKIYNYYTPQSRIIDITVEDPSDDFQRVRDFTDCTLTYNRFKFVKSEYQTIKRYIRGTLKLSKLQTRRIFDILRLREIGSNQAELDTYKEEMITRRLLGRRCQMAVAIDTESPEDRRHAELQTEARIKQFRRVLSRLEKFIEDRRYCIELSSDSDSEGEPKAKRARGASTTCLQEPTVSNARELLNPSLLEGSFAINLSPATLTLSPSTIAPSPSIITLSPSTLTHSPSTLTLSPSTIAPSPSIITLSPSTLTLSPSTLTRSPSTLTRSPSTLTLSPSTLTLSPSILTPSPSTQLPSTPSTPVLENSTQSTPEIIYPIITIDDDDDDDDCDEDVNRV